jgi:pimeloyl-ACP methyl ester carboxylesterase
MTSSALPSSLSSELPSVVLVRSDSPKQPTVIYVAGFPDNQLSSLHPTVWEAIAKDYNLVCLCLPGYELGDKVIRPWGYSMDELIMMLHYSISLHAKADQPIYLIGHDWGSYLSMIYTAKYPTAIQKLVLLDVGQLDLASCTIKHILIFMFYQLWFGFAYILSQLLGHLVGNIMFQLLFLPIFEPFLPCKFDSSSNLGVVEKCYPYYYIWKALLMQRRDLVPKFPSCVTLFLVSDDPTV